MNLKAELARIILDRTAERVPLNEARVVTMGGLGIEPRVWQKYGVLDTNGWLVEHSLNRGAHLIKNLKYRVHNQLGTLYQVLVGCYGTEGASIDSCHLDLCGTLSGRASADFSTVLPLVLKSRARCLAVTVADARQNAILEHWPDFEARGKKIFGGTARNLLETFKAQQEKIPVNRDLPSHFQLFDPEKGAKREFGVLVELAELLFATGVHWTPERIERYVYVSRYSGKPFRMRTYIISFGRGLGRPPSLRKSLENLVEMWVESPLFYANGGGFADVDNGHRPVARVPERGPKPLKPEQLQLRKVKTMTKIRSRLGEVARAMGGAEFEEYQQLKSAENALASFLTVANDYRKNMGRSGHASPAKANSNASSRTPFPKASKRAWDDLSPQEQIAWLLDTLEVRVAVTSMAEWVKTLDELKVKTFGSYSKATNYAIRTALACTSGRNRPKFATRIKEAYGDDAQPYLDRLAKLPERLPTI